MFAKPNRHLKATAAAASLLALLAGAPSAALACTPDSYIGSLCTVAFNFCPEGTLPAQGQLLPVNQYQVLFSLLGTMYGGNGSTNFALPDLRGRVIVNSGTTSTGVVINQGQVRGAESVTLTAANVPAHTHPATFAATAGGNLTLPLSGSATNVPVTGSVTVNALTNQTTGGVPTPTSANNAAGKFGTASGYYPYNSGSAVASPSSFSLTASGGTLTGSAAGAVSLPVAGTINVQPNTPTNPTVSIVNPQVGMMVCIVQNGLYPTRP